jgi:hypothetical protein
MPPTTVDPAEQETTRRPEPPAAVLPVPAAVAAVVVSMVEVEPPLAERGDSADPRRVRARLRQAVEVRPGQPRAERVVPATREMATKPEVAAVVVVARSRGRAEQAETAGSLAVAVAVAVQPHLRAHPVQVAQVDTERST